MLTPEELEAGAAAAAATPPVRFQNDPVTPAMARSLSSAAPDSSALGSASHSSSADPASSETARRGVIGGLVAALRAELSLPAPDLARIRALVQALEGGDEAADAGVRLPGAEPPGPATL